MMEHAILGTDFSSGWRDAVRALPALAELLGIQRITVVHVPDVHPLAADSNVHAQLEPPLADAAREVGAITGRTVTFELHAGTPPEALLAVARERGADVVVVASRGHSRLGELFMGNVALDLARLAEVPLLIVPPGAPMPAGGPVVVATDGSAACAGAERVFAALVGGGRRGIALAVEDRDAPQASTIGAHARELAAATAGATALVRSGDPRVLVAETAEREGAALLIVGQRSHNPIAQLVLGSTAESALRAAVCPVLVVPA
jgi:nucleotide-binding universal stress UspA family protein